MRPSAPRRTITSPSASRKVRLRSASSLSSQLRSPSSSMRASSRATSAASRRLRRHSSASAAHASSTPTITGAEKSASHRRLTFGRRIFACRPCDSLPDEKDLARILGVKADARLTPVASIRTICHAAALASDEMRGRQQGRRALRRERVRAHIDAVSAAPDRRSGRPPGRARSPPHRSSRCGSPRRRSRAPSRRRRPGRSRPRPGSRRAGCGRPARSRPDRSAPCMSARAPGAASR